MSGWLLLLCLPGLLAQPPPRGRRTPPHHHFFQRVGGHVGSENVKRFFGGPDISSEELAEAEQRFGAGSGSEETAGFASFRSISSGRGVRPAPKTRVRPFDEDFRTQVGTDVAEAATQEVDNAQCSATCVRPPGVEGALSDCIAYDPQFQAVTFEEALLNFQDLTMPSESWRQNGTGVGVQCESGDEECAVCQEEFLEYLSQGSQLDLIQKAYPSIREWRKVTNTRKKTSKKRKRSCKRYGFGYDTTRPDNAAKTESSGWSQFEEEITKEGAAEWEKHRRRNGRRGQGQSGESHEGHHGGKRRPGNRGGKRRPITRKPHANNRRGNRAPRTRTPGLIDRYKQRARRPSPDKQRTKRQARSSEPQVTVIDCVRKGEYRELGGASNEGSSGGAVGMCNLCWVWVKLPDNYFPSILNEIRCLSKPKDGSPIDPANPRDVDLRCLKGHGECVSRQRTVPVLIWPTDENGEVQTGRGWERGSVQTSACCDCHIFRDSRFAGLAADDEV